MDSDTASDLLRRRGYTVLRDGDRFRLDGVVKTRSELLAIATREERLMQPAGGGATCRRQRQ